MISTTLFSTLQQSKSEPCDNNCIIQVRFLVQIATDEKSNGCQPPIILPESVNVLQDISNPSMIQDRFKDPVHFAIHKTQLKHLQQPSHTENSNHPFLFQPLSVIWRTCKKHSVIYSRVLPHQKTQPNNLAFTQRN